MTAYRIQPDQAAAIKRFLNLQALFAMRGRELVRSVRADDGRVSYTVTHAGDSRHFTHWHDLEAHLRAIQSQFAPSLTPG